MISSRTMNPVEQLRRLIRDVPDFPKPGIMFRDITPLLRNPPGLALSVELMANQFRGQGFELVVGAESRGFIFGIAVAQALSCGFVPVRKPGKLPHRTASATYSLEYGMDTLEMQEDAIPTGSKVLVVDDLLATGGTMKACCELVERLGGRVEGCTVLIELQALGGRARLAPRQVQSVIQYA
ncbi:MAG: adenine phosphoribosyltransferase [Phycisphaerae bacterium]|nr:adenine phosphoribosyltransferase [Phycisphaerae bacterium]